MAEPRTDQMELLREELAELDEQVAAGDLDEATADTLRNRYAAELAALEAQTDGGASDAVPADHVRRGRVSGRVLAGAAILGVAIVAVGALAIRSLDSGTGGAEGVAGDAVTSDGPVDLSEVTNEQLEVVVAENPTVVGMRLALARRYFEEGTFDKALDHYFIVLDQEQHPEALANIGWMTYLSQRPDVALGYLEAALQRQPDYLPAQWFISNVLVDLGRPDEAVPYLVGLLQSDDVPDEVKDGAETLLRQIESGS